MLLFSFEKWSHVSQAIIKRKTLATITGFIFNSKINTFLLDYKNKTKQTLIVCMEQRNPLVCVILNEWVLLTLATHVKNPRALDPWRNGKAFSDMVRIRGMANPF